MGFDNTAEERITKEMITDYHKKEQDNIEERLKGRTKTTLHDSIDSEIVKSVPLTFNVLTKYNVFSIVPPNVDPVNVMGMLT